MPRVQTGVDRADVGDSRFLSRAFGLRIPAAGFPVMTDIRKFYFIRFASDKEQIKCPLTNSIVDKSIRCLFGSLNCDYILLKDSDRFYSVNYYNYFSTFSQLV